MDSTYEKSRVELWRGVDVEESIFHVISAAALTMPILLSRELHPTVKNGRLVKLLGSPLEEVVNPLILEISPDDSSLWRKDST